MTATTSPKVLVAAALALAACASSETDEGPSVGRLVARGEYDAAVALAAAEREEHPRDPQAEENHRVATVAWYLEQGRRASFEARDEEALEHFHAAQELAPESPVVAAWVEKTNAELARRWAERALELYAEDRLEDAVDACEWGLAYAPADRTLLYGLQRALLLLNHRAGMSDAYYNDGVRALSDYWLHEAKARFHYSSKYVPANERAQARTEQVDELLAEGRMAIARNLEAGGNYAAARNEYRLAITLDPDFPQAREGFERTAREAEAAERLSQAQMHVFRERFDLARVAIAEGRALTEHQQDEFDAALAGLEEARLRSLYERARNLESDYRFGEAIESYTALLEEAEYYEDAITRRSTLQSYVDDAARFYERAAAAGEPEEEARWLRQIELIWPDYRDVRERLSELDGG